MILVWVSNEFQKYFIFAVYMRDFRWDFAPLCLYVAARLRLKWTFFEILENLPEISWIKVFRKIDSFE